MRVGNPYKFFKQLDSEVMEKFNERFGSIARLLFMRIHLYL
jgi:hypothetical protein